MKKSDLNKLISAALFLSLGVTLPFLTGSIKEIGDSLLPMHLPVMLCGLLCGPAYGCAVGAVTPLLKSVISSMPPIYPNAIWMAAELMTYGLVIGIIYSCFRKKNTLAVYVSLISAMLAGRVAWGIVKAFLLTGQGKAFTLAMFIAGGFADALLGIILQLILIPVIMIILKKER